VKFPKGGMIIGLILFLFFWSRFVHISIYGTIVLSPFLHIFALLITIFGIILRFWSMTILGKNFTRQLIVVDEQKLITYGPYKFIRHPGYLSNFLVWIGCLFVITKNIVIFIPFLVIFIFVY